MLRHRKVVQEVALATGQRRGAKLVVLKDTPPPLLVPVAVKVIFDTRDASML